MAPCCAEPDNREVQEQREDVTVHVCRVCGRRHIEVTVDPGLFAIRRPAPGD